MKKISFFAVLGIPLFINAQFDPPAGQAGSKAISKDDPLFVNWASGAVVTRGPQNITSPSGPFANVGTESSAIGKANGVDIVSLGDGGSAILTFPKPITNGSGADFAVFENSFNDTFLELAFVEASSDGVNFFRFPATSNTSTTQQVGSFGSVDATKINNLAGKYRSGFGTPFDLDDLPDSALLNKQSITHIKVIDVVGTVNPSYATYDSVGNIVNDPYPTAFGSGGFDLDAVGVINEFSSLGTTNTKAIFYGIYPNPAKDYLVIQNASPSTQVNIYDTSGKIISSKTVQNDTKIDIKDVPAGNYIIKVLDDRYKTQKVIISK